MTIEFDNKIITGAPALRVILVEAEVVNPPTPDALWGEIEAEAAIYTSRFRWRVCACVRQSTPQGLYTKLSGRIPTAIGQARKR